MAGGPLVLLAAGGTGGHLFPAQALAQALIQRDAVIHLATDERASRYGGAFPAQEIHEIASATPSGRSPLGMARAAIMLGRGLLTSYGLVGRLRPAVVVGFGGYPTVPPVLAAALRGYPTVIHEQNGVIGRANRMLASRASVIATGFASVRGIAPGLESRLVHTGNPVRPAVLTAAAIPYQPPQPGGRLKIVAFGGSQGARIMSDVVPSAIDLLTPAERLRLDIVQQSRDEDVGRVRQTYARLGVAADVSSFFPDMPARIAACHFVVARSGASTVAELSVIGRPSILVPLPQSLDGDQAANAQTLEQLGAAQVIPQPDFTPRRLAAELSARLADPSGLAAAAAAAKGAGIPDAAERLADLVLGLARKT
jgi:UDP-N-acetylglucosamine--N-acetylmuramyl-(pentapeptide) pyrophosphoryl-undecaprenol N-acetylglucosamine transferase